MTIDFDKIYMGIKLDEYKFLGKGSGRKVYDLGNGYVVKVAKNRRGFAQNEAEYAISLKAKEELFARVLCVSDNFGFLIMEKAEPVSKISFVWEYFNVENNKQMYKLKILRKLEIEYKLLIHDFGRAKNWGKIGDRPVIVDYGFTQKVRNRFY